MRYCHHLLIALLIFTTGITSNAQQVATHTQQQSSAQKTVSIPIEIASGDFIHKDQLLICTDHPHVHIDSWKSTIDPIVMYDPTFNEDKKVFNQPFSIEATLVYPQELDTTHIHISYYRHAKRALQEELIAVSFTEQKCTEQQQISTAVDSENAQVVEQTDVAPESKTPAPTTSISCYVQNMVQKTDNIWLRILLVLLLGLLMSLTPCIYPMIPITIGILQSQGSQSMLRNFLLAACYTMGIATMFALLGLLAASTGQMFGAIMANPIVILSIVGLLAYLAFSMLGFYEMYVPRFMSGGNNQVKSGSLLSIFLFGVVSGSVASPCLSPGLILLLTIVTALKSKLLGFALLFSFGIGLSLPLLVVGTFSSALNTLPRAGMWMVEVKKFFGVILFGMCFYFLNMILPWHVVILLVTTSTFLFGIFYLYHAQLSTGFIKRTNNLLGMALTAVSIPLCIESYKAFIQRNACPVIHDIWITDYHCAKEKAATHNKPLLMKVGGPCCSMCTAIDEKQFANSRVLSVIERNYVPVKIDGTEISDTVAHIKKTYTIHGFPTILIINPKNEIPIKQWGSNLYDVDPAMLAQELEEIRL